MAIEAIKKKKTYFCKQIFGHIFHLIGVFIYHRSRGLSLIRTLSNSLTSPELKHRLPPEMRDKCRHIQNQRAKSKAMSFIIVVTDHPHSQYHIPFSVRFPCPITLFSPRCPAVRNSHTLWQGI